MTSRSGGSPSGALKRAAPAVRCMASARRSASIRLRGLALPVPASAKAVPWSGEVRTKGKPERDVDAGRRRRAS